MGNQIGADGSGNRHCFGGWLADKGIPVATAMSYLDGAASVVGRKRTGAYGFRDFVEAVAALPAGLMWHKSLEIISISAIYDHCI